MVLSVFLKGAAGDDLYSPIIFSQNTPMSILSDDLKCQALFLLLFLEIRPVFCMAHTGGFFLAEEEEPSFFFFFLGDIYATAGGTAWPSRALVPHAEEPLPLLTRSIREGILLYCSLNFTIFLSTHINALK